MEVAVMDSQDLYYAFIAGAQSVINEKAVLNKINVFPVPDGDTGTNLASTMNAIIYQSSLHNSINDTLASIADAAMMGARGNSGIIFAQFIHGIYQETPSHDQVTFSDIICAIKKAVPYAYNAIEKPVEGTMITVIKEWAQSLTDECKHYEGFIQNFNQSLDTADKSLENTPKLLKILKDAKVVDSGAKGFVIFLNGFVQYLKKPNKNLLNDLKMSNVERDEVFDTEMLPDQAIHFRYCTEGVVNLNDPHFDLRNTLAPFGDSLIIAGTTEKRRIHIHTNHPDQVFLNLRKHSTLLEQKVEDMVFQQQIIHNRKYPIAIVTDSIADIPEELIEKYQIHRIHLQLLIDGVTFYDRLTIQPNSFYGLINELNEYPTSSLPTKKSIDNMLSYLTTYYDQIIIMPVSSALSGTYSIIKQSVQSYIDSDKKITVIDTKLNSAAQGLAVIQAAKWIEAGVGYDVIVDKISDNLRNTKIFVNLDTLDYMVKSGRVKKQLGVIAGLLHMKPIVSLDENGKGIVLGQAFSRKSSGTKILKLIEEWCKDKGKVVTGFNIVHANAQAEALAFKLTVEGTLGITCDYVCDISTITAMSAGLGSIALGITFCDRDIERSKV